MFRHRSRALTIVVSLIAATAVQSAPPGTETPRIAVDQFGYLPWMTKVAVISDPQTGFNSAEAYTPGATLELREWGTNAVVHSAAPTSWNGGATHTQSGDRAWWFDFSSVRKWGEYYVYDPANDRRSARFQISHRVYDDVLKQAMRTFFYQRRGFAKQVPFADAKWADGASHLKSGQDTQCRLVTAQNDASTARDLRGGWFDAGDYNKYTNFTGGVLSDLLFAYERNPLIWGDDFNLPESGNGIPDILDEVKWELDFLLRVQQANGSLLSKVSSLGFNTASPPSADTSAMYYGAASTSATLTGAAAFAHASRVFGSIGQTAYADQLRAAAIRAWDWADANPAVIFSNTGFDSVNPETGANGRAQSKVRAAAHLFSIVPTADKPKYRTYVEANYEAAHPSNYWYWSANDAALQDTMLFYSRLPGVSSSVATTINARKQSSMDNTAEFLPNFDNRTDAYRAYLKTDDYVWGNNRTKSHVGIVFWQQVLYNLDSADVAKYRSAAAGYLHYIHGTNPLSMTFLSNMYAHGGDRCANEIYHAWFGHGTDWDNALTSTKGPAPGYLPGGPVADFRGQSGYSGPTMSPPENQPTQKSYRDWNTGWPDSSWAITEPAIYYQSAYVHLLSCFLAPLTYEDWQTGHGLTGPSGEPQSDGDKDGASNLTEFAFDLSPIVPDSERLPKGLAKSHTVNSETRQYLTITFPRHLSTGDLTYIVEASADLRDWTPVCTAAARNAPTGPGFVSEQGTGYLRSITARDTQPIDSEVKRFLRVRVRR